YPAPAVGKRATTDIDELVQNDDRSQNEASSSYQNSSPDHRQQSIQPVAGTLPKSANSLSNAARGLLMRLLERDPRVRIRNLRQLQQSAFYMKYNFEHVKTKKVSPRSILERHFPDSATESPKNIRMNSLGAFTNKSSHTHDTQTLNNLWIKQRGAPCGNRTSYMARLPSYRASPAVLEFNYQEKNIV
ncbi:hypothetical protein SFRURICE_012394, partial [Spodoptera frugiperda]